jgi:arginine exporter protein ArgO
MKLEKKNVLVIIFFSLLVLLISILFNKSLNAILKFLLSGLLFLIGLGLFVLYDKFSEDDKIKQAQKLKEEKERKKRKNMKGYSRKESNILKNSKKMD